MEENILREIEARADAATEGPWTHRYEWGGSVYMGAQSFVRRDVPSERLSDADLTFIAHARTDIPALIAEVRRARAEAEELRLTLAAEQGRQEGAPSEGWLCEAGDWLKTYSDGSFAGLSGARGKRSWMRASWPDTTQPPCYLGRGWDVATDRAAMIAADKANP